MPVKRWLLLAVAPLRGHCSTGKWPKRLAMSPCCAGSPTYVLSRPDTDTASLVAQIFARKVSLYPDAVGKMSPFKHLPSGLSRRWPNGIKRLLLNGLKKNWVMTLMLIPTLIPITNLGINVALVPNGDLFTALV